LRANIVKSYLVRKGIAIERIKAFWMGSENPAASKDSQEDRIKTHQVEVRLNEIQG
jgi:outer membrane protein OmpA-like peptidoglycan-associated protein